MKTLHFVQVLLLQFVSCILGLVLLNKIFLEFGLLGEVSEGKLSLVGWFFIVTLITILFFICYVRPKNKLKKGGEISRNFLGNIEHASAFIPVLGMYWYKRPYRLLRQIQEKYALAIHKKHIVNAIYYAEKGMIGFTLQSLYFVTRETPENLYIYKPSLIFSELKKIYTARLDELDLSFLKEEVLKRYLENSNYTLQGYNSSNLEKVGEMSKTDKVRKEKEKKQVLNVINDLKEMERKLLLFSGSKIKEYLLDKCNQYGMAV